MKKPAKDPIREDRIHNEAIVDAYGPEEQAMGWYYYLENKIRFPFQAKCIAGKVVSPLRKGETVEVRGLAPEDACASDMLACLSQFSMFVAGKCFKSSRSYAKVFTTEGRLSSGRNGIGGTTGDSRERLGRQFELKFLQE